MPLAFAVLLLAGAGAASRLLTPLGVRMLAVAATAVLCAASEPVACLPLAVVGWLAVAAFARAPYGQLQFAGTWRTGLLIGGVGVVATCAGSVARGARRRVDQAAWRLAAGPGTLEVVPPDNEDSAGFARRARLAARSRDRWQERREALAALSMRRRLSGLALAAVLLPLLTIVLSDWRAQLALADELLLYLVAVIVVTVIGGFWPAVLAAVAASLLLNWYFTPPLHTWNTDSPRSLLALLLFETVAITVSSVVHRSARRAAVAARRSEEAGILLGLARTVLAGADTPDAVIEHLARVVGLHAELLERSGPRWIAIAGRAPAEGAECVTIPAGDNLRLRVYGSQLHRSAPAVLEAFAAQTFASLERDRLRVQAAQAEALAAGNRMRTALLTAVSHDLRTPLASVKAAVTSLRQTDVAWSDADRAELLASIEEGADRLGGLIANLLDMSRIQTGALQPFLRPTGVDEVVPLVAAELDGGECLRLDIPEDLPLVRADPVLLERVLANLVGNALRYAPPGEPPALLAHADDEAVVVEVIDRGPGVPPMQRGTMFEPFQQFGDRRTGGVGLGLAVAKGFVEAMGGQIEADSTLGGGLTMRLRLPLAVPSPARAQVSPA